LDQGFYLLAFDSTQHSMKADKLAAGHFRAAIVPTPTEITSGCGFSLRFYEGDAEVLLDFAHKLPVPAKLYHLGEKGPDGRRAVTTIGEGGAG